MLEWMPALYEFKAGRRHIKVVASAAFEGCGLLMDILPRNPRPTYESTRKTRGDDLEVLAEVAKDLK